MEKDLRTIIDVIAPYAFSLIQESKTASMLALRSNEIGSHVEAIGKDGWQHVREGDEYSPFMYGDYFVFTATDKSMSVQFAVTFRSNKIYVTGYISTKKGWFEWEEYKAEPIYAHLEHTGKAALSFEQALEKARQRVRKREQPISYGMDNEALNNQVYSRDGLKSKVEKTAVDTGNKDKPFKEIGMNIYTEEARSTEYSRYS